MKLIKKNIIMIILIFQPILDIFAFFSMNTKLSIIPFIIRAAILLISSYIIFIRNINNKKYILSIGIIFIYCLLHLINTYFTTNLSLVEDIKELVRIFYMPILLINGYMYSKEDSNMFEQLKKGVIINTLIVFLVIILGLITNTSIPTYAEGIGLRGWFYNSNSQSLILCITVPLFLFYCFKNKNIFVKIISTIISFFLLYTNGTTGCYIMLFPTFIIPFIYVITSKNSNKIKTLEIFMLSGAIFLSIAIYKYSPEYKIDNMQNSSFTDVKEQFKDVIDNNENNNDLNKGEQDKNNNSTEQNKEENNNNTEQNKEENLLSMDNIDKNSKLDKSKKELIYYYFDKNFIKDYGYDIIYKSLEDNFDLNHLVNNRFRKKTVAKIIFNESKISTKILGIEFTKINQYGYDMESDYSSILYYCGYLGFTIYLSLIIYIIFRLFITFICKPKLMLNAEFLVLSSVFCIANLGAELSGSLLRRPNASIYLCVLAIMILIKYGEKHEKKRN